MAADASLEIKRLGPADVSTMRDLLAAFADAFDDRASYLSRQPGDTYLAALLARDGFIALAAVKEGAVIGGLTAYVLEKYEQARSEVYIYDLAVREASRRQGIATALIERLKPLARERGARVIYVQADLTDAPAIALYSGLGSRENVLHFDIDAAS